MIGLIFLVSVPSAFAENSIKVDYFPKTERIIVDFDIDAQKCGMTIQIIDRLTSNIFSIPKDTVYLGGAVENGKEVIACDGEIGFPKNPFLINERIGIEISVFDLDNPAKPLVKAVIEKMNRFTNSDTAKEACQFSSFFGLKYSSLELVGIEARTYTTPDCKLQKSTSEQTPKPIPKSAPTVDVFYNYLTEEIKIEYDIDSANCGIEIGVFANNNISNLVPDRDTLGGTKLNDRQESIPCSGTLNTDMAFLSQEESFEATILFYDFDRSTDSALSIFVLKNNDKIHNEGLYRGQCIATQLKAYIITYSTEFVLIEPPNCKRQPTPIEQPDPVVDSIKEKFDVNYSINPEILTIDYSFPAENCFLIVTQNLFTPEGIPFSNTIDDNPVSCQTILNYSIDKLKFTDKLSLEGTIVTTEGTTIIDLGHFELYINSGDQLGPIINDCERSSANSSYIYVVGNIEMTFSTPTCNVVTNEVTSSGLSTDIPPTSTEAAPKKNKSGGGCSGDCTPPTLGLDNNGKLIVRDGITINGHSEDGGYFHTEYPMQYTTLGRENVITLKYYDNGGPQNIEIVQLGLGIKEIGTPLSQSQTLLELHMDFFGGDIDTPVIKELVIVGDKNLVSNVSATAELRECDDVYSEDSVAFKVSDLLDDKVEFYSHLISQTCLQVEFVYTYDNIPESVVLASNAIDNKRNTFNNYFNDGLTVIDPNPPAPIVIEVEPVKACTSSKSTIDRNDCPFTLLKTFESARASYYYPDYSNFD